MSSGKCKLKQKWDITTHLFQWARPRALTTPSAVVVRAWSDRDSPSPLVGVRHGAATLEGSLAISYKTEHTLSTQSSSWAPRCPPKGAKNTFTQTPALGRVSSLMYNWWNAEGTKTSFSRWGVTNGGPSRPSDVECSELKRNELSGQEETGRKRQSTALSETSWPEGYTLHSPNYETFGKRSSWEDSKAISGCPGWGVGGGMNRGSTEDFYSSETSQYDNTVAELCHYTFVPTHRVYDMKTEP